MASGQPRGGFEDLSFISFRGALPHHNEIAVDEFPKKMGARSAVTSGAQMDGFIELFMELVTEAGIDRTHIFYRRGCLELPGYFRPTKQWDFLVVVKDQLVAALEAKSQVGKRIRP